MIIQGDFEYRCDADGCGAISMQKCGTWFGQTQNPFPPDGWFGLESRIYCPKHDFKIIDK